MNEVNEFFRIGKDLLVESVVHARHKEPVGRVNELGRVFFIALLVIVSFEVREFLLCIHRFTQIFFFCESFNALEVGKCRLEQIDHVVVFRCHEQGLRTLFVEFGNWH